MVDSTYTMLIAVSLHRSLEGKALEVVRTMGTPAIVDCVSRRIGRSRNTAKELRLELDLGSLKMEGAACADRGIIAPVTWFLSRHVIKGR